MKAQRPKQLAPFACPKCGEELIVWLISRATATVRPTGAPPPSNRRIGNRKRPVPAGRFHTREK